MRFDPHTLDVGVRDVVAVLNRIPGVTTRASCQGAGAPQSRHRHAELAYVALRYPMPLRLQAFAVAHLDDTARIEDDAVYSRWPTHNRVFLERLAVTARAYLAAHAAHRQRHVRRPLASLRATLARAVAAGRDTRAALCLECENLVLAPHAGSHRTIALLCIPADQETRWFAEFVTQPGNALDAALIARDGWASIMARTQRGDFGPRFHRRWLRYRTRMIAALTTRQLRTGAQHARRHGTEIDFFYNASHAVFAWRHTGG